MTNNDIKNSYDSIAPHFNLTRKKLLQPELFDFKQYLQDGQSVLDIGCGSGRMLRILKDFEISYCGLDISLNQINYAKNEDLGKIKKTDFITKDILNANFEDNSFDIILCIATFHHIKTKKERISLLKDMYKWLKPGGYLLMTNWNLFQRIYIKYILNFQKYSWNDFLVPYRDSNGKLLTNRFYHSFTNAELKGLILKTGFNLEKIEFSSNKNNIISVCRK
ncbi:MAG: methyltransferase domain-containing protein [Patescibacteria group bacterium]|nr:methyltransferase domain-containing protein [Patescibacteria group bacterium]MDD4304766.1 methyltransferase domain-containing protein [Patescibacteria group bacterium]MDD4695495.1 methyltransferase domain-containing protein [Patescibacteria group bacterium]